MADASGWATLGSALGGDSSLEYEKGRAMGAQTENALTQARQRVDQARAIAELAPKIEAAGVPRARAVALAGNAAAGGTLGDMMGALSGNQKFENTAILSDPTQLNTAAQTAAQQGIQGQVALPVAVPKEYTTLAGMAPPRVQQTPYGAAETGAALGGSDKTLLNVVDPNSSGGYRTIKRSDWAGQQEYQKPAMGAITADALTGDPLVSAGARYRLTGEIPASLGRAPAVTLKILNEAARQAAELGQTAQVQSIQQQTNKAGRAALGRLESQRTLVGAFERTATMNGDLAVKMSQAAGEGQVPLLNRWINVGRTQGTNDPALAQFNAANLAFTTEYAKVMSGSMGNTPASDAARAHADAVLNPAMTPQAYAAAVETLKLDMENRMKGFEQERSGLVDVLGGAAVGDSAALTGIPTPGGPASISTDAEYAKLPSGTEFVGPDGQRRKKP